ncbi:MAG: aldehyde dehydrogenase family protein [Actinobacteria bacterium]|nr:aldehyde dehydrogenase family protein [Actinomycetota bacterium]
MPVATPVDGTVQDFTKRTHRLLIDGAWVEPAEGGTFVTRNPATEEELSSVALAGSGDVDRAVAAARRAFDDDHGWRTISGAERSKIVWRIGELIEQHADELALLESLDNGKPVDLARTIDMVFAGDLFRYMAGWSTKLEGDTIALSSFPRPGQAHAYTVREPVGVVAQIIPWNFPLLMASWKVAPALACGCTVILKPAEQTPLTALRMAELIQEAGVPDGVFNILTGEGETGAALVAHPLVDKVAFTGSTEVGKSIVRAAAGNLKRVTLELGGKSASVVYDDADLETAIPNAANAVFANIGECCTAASRLYIQRSIYDEVVAGVSEVARTIKIGVGTDPESEMGPLISSEQLERVSGFIEAGRSDGAELVTGGSRIGDTGYFIEPTVFTKTSPEMSIEREEIFGPVVSAIPFDSFEEVVERANDTHYGLAAGVFTHDLKRAHQTASLLRAGTVWINTYNHNDPALPFGGYKQSGWGREMGHEVLDAYLQTKAVCAVL